MCTWGCPGERGSGMRRSTISSSWGELKKVSLNAAEPSLSDPICAFEIESEKFQEPNVLPFQMISLVWHSGRWMMSVGRGLWNFLGSLTLQSLSSAGCSQELARQRNFWGMAQSQWLSLWKEELKISFKTGVLFHWCMHTQHCLELRMQRSCWETLPLAEHSSCPWKKELQITRVVWLLYLKVCGVGEAK